MEGGLLAVVEGEHDQWMDQVDGIGETTQRDPTRPRQQITDISYNNDKNMDGIGQDNSALSDLEDHSLTMTTGHRFILQ